MAIPSNSLTGTTASEILNGAGSVATNISGDAGADTITLNNADSYGNGGEGDDSIIFGTSGDVISTFDGLMSGEGGNDYLSFTASDVVASNAASFMGGKGNDTIALGSAGTYTNAVVGGGLGNDSIALESGTWSNLSIKAGDNADTIAISTGTTVSTKTSYFGAKGADSISVLTDDVSTSSSIYAGMGHDTIVIGGAETTYVVGGFGNDSVLLNSGSDTSLTIVGGGMADTINLGSSFEGLIYGDTLTEGSNDGADTIGSTAQTLLVLPLFTVVVAQTPLLSAVKLKRRSCQVDPQVTASRSTTLEQLSPLTVVKVLTPLCFQAMFQQVVLSLVVLVQTRSTSIAPLVVA